MIRIAGGVEEGGIVVGNTYDKYGSGNPLVKRIMSDFCDSISSLVGKAAPKTIHEIGCGEGYWVLHWLRQGILARGSDFSSKVIQLARDNALGQGYTSNLFKVRSIYDLQPGRDSADLIVCCEVLEHLKSPDEGFRSLQRTATDYIILSVPREPLWRLLNFLRGKYLDDFGNTPGHVQHWSRRAFIRLAERYFDIVEVRAPPPWTMLLCRTRR